MSWRMWMSGSLLGVLLFVATGSVRAEEEPAATAGSAERLLEKGLDALRLRMQAAVKEADLLAAQGRVDEALLKYREAARVYEEAFAQLRELIERATLPLDIQGPAGGALPGRAAAGEVLAAPTSAQEAIARSLRWLAAHQAPSGAFEADTFGRWADGKPLPPERAVPGAGKGVYTVGTTALATLAFLGAGHTPKGRGMYAEGVGRAITYLLGSQDSEGCIGARTSQHYIYNHAIAGLALVEAYALTRDPRLKGPAQRALDFAALARNPFMAWRYGVRPGDSDTSVTAWMTALMASARAINSEGVAKKRVPEFALDDGAFQGALNWIDKMTEPETGRVGYLQRGGSSARPAELLDAFPAEHSEAMTAAGLMVRRYCGQSPDDSLWQKGLGLLRRSPPRWDPSGGSIDMYYWYYGTHACFQAGGDAWRDWSRALSAALLANQQREGTPAGLLGSFDPIGPWGPDGGRVYATALMTLALQVVDRYDSATRGAR